MGNIGSADAQKGGSASTAPVHPLDETPNAVWYIRPSSGGQFGPATGEVMRTWLKEGRIGPDSLIWCEGWRDWQEAKSVFPELQNEGDSALAALTATEASARTSMARRPVSSRRSNTSHALVITILIVAVIVLGIVFLIVINRTMHPPAEPEPAAETSVSIESTLQPPLANEALIL